MAIVALVLSSCQNSDDPTTESAAPGQPAGGQAGAEQAVPGGFVVSDVTGNTAQVNATAEFSVALASEPSADVTISVASSDADEGVPEQAELTFTPENWFRAQTVVVRGTNPDLSDGEQDYRIELGAAVSDDPQYDGLDPDDVEMRGVALALEAPVDMPAFVANVPATLEPVVAYTGSNLLSFALTEAPEGMTIDLSSGLMSWTPQAADEGQSYAVQVTVNDGTRFAELDLEITVPEPTPLAVEIDGSTLTVVDESSNLDGMSITQLEGDDVLAQLDLAALDTDEVPETPEWFTTISDVLVVRGTFDQDTVLRFPLTDVPGEVPLSDVKLLALIEASDEDEVDEQVWAPVAIVTEYEGTSDDPVIAVELGRLQGLLMWAYATADDADDGDAGPDSSASADTTAAASTATTSAAANVTCVQRSGPPPAEHTLNEYVCTASQQVGSGTLQSEIRITGWCPSPPASSAPSVPDCRATTRWRGISMTDMVSYLQKAQLWFATHALGFDHRFSVSVETMNPGSLGRVRSREDRKVLHLTDRVEPKATMQGTIVHEYFHHAQSHPETLIEGQVLLNNLGGKPRKWISEGTARWFEDELFDTIDSYVEKESQGGKRIAEVGIADGTGSGRYRPYQRFTFFKLMTTKCASFESDIRNIFNVSGTSDRSGIEKFTSRLETFGCDFGTHFGVDKKATLEAALAYYNYATQLENKISLLDPNESDETFEFDTTVRRFDASFPTSLDGVDAAGPSKLLDVTVVPKAAALSFEVPAIPGALADDKVAELVVDSDQEVLVSITSSSADFTGTNTIGDAKHSYFSTKDEASYVYDAAGTAPKLFVTLVNPSIEDRAVVDVSFQIRDVLTIVPVISSHATGDQISNRVITVEGEIPAEARSATTSVRLNVNGIASTEPMDANGTYSIKAVVALGENIVKVQGLDGQGKPTTNVAVLTLEGVESATGGANALIPSRAVFVMRWDTNNTDVDIYSTDKNGDTIWYGNRVVGSANLDIDNQSGFGPEVVSYRVSADEGANPYKDGSFLLDVHFYSGGTPTGFTVDVILNETEPDNRRVLRYLSKEKLPAGNSGEDEPGGSGASRVNDIVTISCGADAVCSLKEFDDNVLTQFGRPEVP